MSMSEQEISSQKVKMKEVSKEELIVVIKDFIELGLVENIMAMLQQDTTLYRLTGELINDERFKVRMGVAVLFEELKESNPEDVVLAIPALLPLLEEKTSYLRGEAASLLMTIGTPEAVLAIARLKNDPDPQVAEMVSDFLLTVANTVTPSSPASDKVP